MIVIWCKYTNNFNKSLLSRLEIIGLKKARIP